jgi:hypothetical protein
MDKGYDYDDVHQFVELARYIVHIKHGRRRGEPKLEECSVSGETQFPARRWEVECTLSWQNDAACALADTKKRQLAWFHSTRLFPHSLGYGGLWIDTKWKLFRPGEKAWYGSQINSRSERHTIASFIVVAEGVLIDRMQCSGIVDP